MHESDLIYSVRNLRKLITTLDSIGFLLKDILNDDNICKFIPDNLHKDIISVTSKLHIALQDLEKSREYRDSVEKLCNSNVRKLNG